MLLCRINVYTMTSTDTWIVRQAARQVSIDIRFGFEIGKKSFEDGPAPLLRLTRDHVLLRGSCLSEAFDTLRQHMWAS